MATRRSSKNSGHLIPDNCYHGHGLRGARLQITATSCLHPCTVVTVSRYFLKGFLTVCTYLRTPTSCKPCSRAQPRLQKRGGMYKAIFFFYLKPENLWPVYARASKNIVSSSRVSDGVEGRGGVENVKNCLRASSFFRYAILAKREGQVVVTKIQWTPRNCRSFHHRSLHEETSRRLLCAATVKNIFLREGKMM